MKIKNIIKLFLLTAWFPLQAQTPAPNIQKHLKSIAKNQNSYLPKDKTEAYYTDEAVIKDLESYLSDENEKVQQEAVSLTARIGSQHQVPESRERAVYQLLTTALSASSIVTEKIAKGLRKFKPADYGEEATEQLLAVIAANRPHQGMYIDLAGYLQLKDALTEMKSTYAENKSLRRNIGMALVRSGDEKKLENLMSKLADIEVNDEFAEGLVPLLVYARQKETFDYLFEVIDSNEKNCTPIGPDIPGRIYCAYRVVEQVAPYIKDFPVEVGASGDLKTDDYKAALKEVWAWIEEHRTDYELIEDKY